MTFMKKNKTVKIVQKPRLCVQVPLSLVVVKSLIKIGHLVLNKSKYLISYVAGLSNLSSESQRNDVNK